MMVNRTQCCGLDLAKEPVEHHFLTLMMSLLLQSLRQLHVASLSSSWRSDFRTPPSTTLLNHCAYETILHAFVRGQIRKLLHTLLVPLMCTLYASLIQRGGRKEETGEGKAAQKAAGESRSHSHKAATVGGEEQLDGAFCRGLSCCCWGRNFVLLEQMIPTHAHVHTHTHMHTHRVQSKAKNNNSVSSLPFFLSCGALSDDH